MPMKTLTSGCTIDRNACGRIDEPQHWVKVRPIARAASAWPTGTVLMPARIASQTKAARGQRQADRARRQNSGRSARRRAARR